MQYGVDDNSYDSDDISNVNWTKTVILHDLHEKLCSLKKLTVMQYLWDFFLWKSDEALSFYAFWESFIRDSVIAEIFM